MLAATQISPENAVVMIFVPAGEFEMGVEDGSDREKPVHTVYLDAFWMDQTEVTNAQYEMCVDADACEPPLDYSSSTRESYFWNPDFADFPVIHVNWGNANEYCSWVGSRLPTEAEWEKAARGTDGRDFPWGESANCQKANFRYYTSSCVGDTTEVGSYSEWVSPYGILDLAGNVWEWVQDWYQENYYTLSPDDNPKGPPRGNTGSFGVARGITIWNLLPPPVAAGSTLSNPGAAAVSVASVVHPHNS
jgi:formylglycine-generating enzyme required for sulfatase activity